MIHPQPSSINTHLIQKKSISATIINGHNSGPELLGSPLKVRYSTGMAPIIMLDRLYLGTSPLTSHWVHISFEVRLWAFRSIPVEFIIRNGLLQRIGQDSSLVLSS